MLESPYKDFECVFKDVWGNNADAISTYYSGTGALKVRESHGDTIYIQYVGSIWSEEDSYMYVTFVCIFMRMCVTLPSPSPPPGSPGVCLFENVFFETFVWGWHV